MNRKRYGKKQLRLTFTYCPTVWGNTDKPRKYFKMFAEKQSYDLCVISHVWHSVNETFALLEC